ncbi:hypothetical protein OPT61_g2750 [Boeremia exigua]|uniref:Uncharacterized protein n=1 Tax=Boeremia exigua TaxID=749465 RepID=A0ACC2IKJ3_9PLEO|nr:hypothetical protein OPT61_g2750 [Boeremia exigua]
MNKDARNMDACPQILRSPDMSSGFVSGGTADAPIERDEEWRQAQREIEEKRREKEELGKQNEGKSLYEVDAADAKQEAFEQAARYKLHVTLDDDEADYLEGILATKLKEEANVKKETREQLELFRRQQEEAERTALDEGDGEVRKEDQVQWAMPGRKRKKGPENTLLKGVKLRKPNSLDEEEKIPVTAANEQDRCTGDAQGATTGASAVRRSIPSTVSDPSKAPSALSLSLGYASSDEGD